MSMHCVFPGISPSLPAQSLPRRESVADSTAFRALLRLEDYLERRSRGMRPGWIFGPNFDDCYFYRIRLKDISEELPGDGVTPQMMFALANGVPALETIPEGERLAMFLAGYSGRRKGAVDARHILCVKHFPGGTRWLENTELVSTTVAFPGGIGDWCRSLEPFEAAIGIAPFLPAVMTSHACYPGLEKDLRELYPEIETWMQPDVLRPATFSPHILQGLLRRMMGFDGPVVTDWVDMGAAFRFLLDYRKRMPATLRELSDNALLFVLSVDAGCNFVTGLKTRQYRMHRTRDLGPCIRELEAYYRGDSARMRRLDARIAETAAWFGKTGLLGLSQTAGRLTELPPASKIRLILGEPVPGEVGAGLKRLSLDSFHDLWNRQALLHLQLRAYYLEERFGVKIPELTYIVDDERVVLKDTNLEWLRRLIAETEYGRYSERIDWQSPESSAQWRRALERFLEQRSR